MPGFHTLVLLGTTFLLSALWAAVFLVLVRLREGEAAATSGGTRLGVELVWAVIPALIVLSVVVPALQTGLGPDSGADGDRMAEVRTGP